VKTVDVIVPCYRYAHYLRECVVSVLSQTDVNVRVLIIDDASPDNTAEVAADLVKEDTRVIFRRHNFNQGHIATYNEGIDWASSADYLLLLSADDYLLPGALSQAVALMDDHPEVGFTFGKALILYENNNEKLRVPGRDKKKWRIISGLDFIWLNGSGNVVSTPTAIVRAKLQKKLGGYRPELPHTGDMEMWLRLAANGSVGIIDEYQAVQRRHANNMSLLYRVDTKLPDLRQRKAAIDCFLETCSHNFDSVSKLRNKLYCSLAYDVLGYARDAFDRGEMQAVDALTEFALEVSPEVRKSLSWKVLSFQCSIGLKVWCILRPMFNSVRWVIWHFKQMVKRLDKDKLIDFFRG